MCIDMTFCKLPKINKHSRAPPQQLMFSFPSNNDWYSCCEI